MRLIDADKLIYQSHAQHLEPYINKKDIDNAPTVEMAEDCVKRDDAQDIMARLLSDYLHDEDREKIENANAEIGELPSVQSQPKRGKWIVHPKGIGAHLVCNKCLSNAPYDCKTNYCPKCGAKMEVDMKEVQDEIS